MSIYFVNPIVYLKRFIFILLTFKISILLQSCSGLDNRSSAKTLRLNEGFENPIGFYTNQPTFSWKLPSEIVAQRSYQIVVASEPELLPDHADLWDSGKLDSDQSIFVPYAGEKLSSRDVFFWQVKFWDEKDVPAPWSETAKAELGLLKNSDWDAKWIGLNTRADSIKTAKTIIIHTPQHLRKDFEVKAELVTAKLYVSAKGVFKGFLNGKPIGNDVMAPGWTPYKKRIETLAYDVTDMVQNGSNTLGFQLSSGWHFGRLLWNKMVWGKTGSPKVLCQLELSFADGTKQVVISDNSWKGTTEGPIRFAEIYDGETYNANYEMPGWATPDYDSSQWKSVNVSDLDEGIALRPKRHSSVKNKVTIPTKNILRPKDEAGVIFDLEQNMVGVPLVKVPMKKGDTLRIRFSEMLAPEGLFYTDNYRSAKSTDYYIANKDGLIEWSPSFTFHGFRYVELSGFDASQAPQKNWVNGLVQFSDFESNGTFSSSDEKLNQLQSNIVWGLRGNFFDIPTDCPQRDERLGWTGDAQVFTPTSMYNANVHAFWSSWLQSLRESQFENGGIPFVAPDVLENGKVSSGWGDAAVIIPWNIYWYSGDTSVLKENYAMMKAWVQHHKDESTDLVSHMNSFGDWLQPYQSKKSNKRGDTSKSLIGTAFFARAAYLTAKTAEVLNKKEEQQIYETLYQDISKAFDASFFDETGKVKNGKGTQTGYLLALHFKLLPNYKISGAQENLLQTIDEADNHLRTGFLGTPLLPFVLDQMGEGKLMYSILFKETYPSWFYSINQGATTMWERWNSYDKLEGYNPQSMNSLNHYAYGAIGQWMYERIAGIKPLAAGYKKIHIAPLPGGGLTSADGAYDTPYGRAISVWKIQDDKFYLQVNVPSNTSALITLPSSFPNNITVNGEVLNTEHHKNVTKAVDGSISFEIFPGHYSIKSIKSK